MILLDTSGLFRLYHSDEAGHQEARDLFDSSGPKVVHSYVLAEFVALTDARGLPRASALAFADALLEQPDVQIVWVDEFLHREGMRLLSSRLDKRYSLADAISFILMQLRGLTEALTTDRHFERRITPSRVQPQGRSVLDLTSARRTVSVPGKVRARDGRGCIPVPRTAFWSAATCRRLRQREQAPALHKSPRAGSGPRTERPG
jgi:predicted nucleic acid-binding protein